MVVPDRLFLSFLLSNDQQQFLQAQQSRAEKRLFFCQYTHNEKNFNLFQKLFVSPSKHGLADGRRARPNLSFLLINGRKRYLKALKGRVQKHTTF